MYNPQAQIDLLQQSINSLKQQYAQPTQPAGQINQLTSYSPMGLTEQQIQQLIQQEIQKYIPAAAPQPKPLTEAEQLIKSINDLAAAVLSPEDLKYLAEPDTLKGVPLFLKSIRGREAMALLMDEYRGYIEGTPEPKKQTI